MTSYSSKRFLIPFIMGSLGFLTILLSEFIVFDQGKKIVEVTWLASLFIVISTLIIRFYSIDGSRVNQIIKETNPLKTSELNPQRYLNWTVISMIVGFLATIIIAFDFIYGVLIYLVMQLCLVVSFSGIITIKPLKFRTIPNLFRKVQFFILFWLILIPAIYFIFIFSGTDSIIVVPYVIAIGIMACISWFGLVYDQRSRPFRLLIVIATGLFVFSDSLIGNDRFSTFEISLNYLIDITYVLNIFLLSHAILFLRGAQGITPFKND
jgi:hypothetical protein